MLDQLAKLGLSGMAQGFAEIEASGEGSTLSHADWLGLLVDREVTHRRDKRLAARLRYPRLRHDAVIEDVEYRAPRGLDRALFHKLAGGEWIDAHDNLILCADPVRPDRPRPVLSAVSAHRYLSTSSRTSCGPRCSA